MDRNGVLALGVVVGEATRGPGYDDQVRASRAQPGRGPQGQRAGTAGNVACDAVGT